MNILGSVGQLYMFVLLVLLFLGSGFALWRFTNFLIERGTVKLGSGERAQVKAVEKNNKEGIVKGGIIMANNGWLKLAVFSFVGIIISVAVLGLLPTGSNQGMSIHQQHQQQGSMNMQGDMNVNMPMGNMPMQGGMNMNGGMGQNDLMMMQQKLNQMQMQLNQMQQQMGMMNGGMNSMQPNSGGGMGMMGGMMGNMGGMNNMQQNSGSMSNMQQNSGSSGGGMGMM